MKLRNIFLFFLITLILSAQQSLSQEITFFGDKSGSIPISQQLQIFEDVHSSLNIDAIVKSDTIHFINTEQLVPSFSFTRSTIWCKFKINYKSSEDCYLEVSPPILNQIVCYEIFENKIDSTVLGSLYTDKNDNFLESNNYVFKLNPNAKFYILKIKTKTRLFIKAQICSFNSLTDKTKKADKVQFMYAGLLIMIFIYNLFLFISTREKIFLYYLLHLINSGIYFLYISGYGIELIWHNFPIINSYFLAIICFGFILSLFFVLEFLETRKNLPIIHRLLQLMMLVLALNGIANLMGYSYFVGILMNYIGFPIILLIIFGAFKLVKNGFIPASTFIYAWLLYLIGIAVQTFQSLRMCLPVCHPPLV